MKKIELDRDDRFIEAASSSAEARRRLEKALEQVNGMGSSPDGLRSVRVVELLEHLDSTGAREILEALAKGAPAARLTEEARRSLGRMGKKMASP